MAAASIGQVHRAVLPNGKRVAVKVQRPDAPRQIEADLALLYQAARIAKERVRALDFIDARELVDEFARSIRQELDYRLEARNAQTFHRNFAGHPHVRIPHVYWSYSRQRVLTLELIEGVQLADLDYGAYTLDERRRLAYLVTEAWMTMIFRHGFFHGDPHPANILVLGAGSDRARRLRPDREAHRRRHVEADRALHRRRGGERRRARPSGSATSASATTTPARPSSPARFASCTTSTTARGSPRSTRSS